MLYCCVAVDCLGLQHGAYADQMGSSRLCKPLGCAGLIYVLSSDLACMHHSSAMHICKIANVARTLRYDGECDVSSKHNSETGVISACFLSEVRIVLEYVSLWSFCRDALFY